MPKCIYRGNHLHTHTGPNLPNVQVFKCEKKETCVDTKDELELIGNAAKSACQGCELFELPAIVARPVERKIEPIQHYAMPIPVVPPATDIPPEKAFDRVVVINLARRTDRQSQAEAEFDKGWPFASPRFYNAIDGQLVQAPNEYREGRNVWACLQSHRHVLENSINEGIESLLVLEDDFVLCEGFSEKALKLMTDIPNDWEICFLGGHHWNSSPIAVKPGITRPQHMDRMHGYAARGTGLIELYRFWHGNHLGHCDHAISKWVTTRKTYCAQPWLIGQRGGTSDVQRLNGIGPGTEKVEEWWITADSNVIQPSATVIESGGIKFASPQPENAKPIVMGGVGTEVSDILHSIGIKTEGCQGCIDLVLKMNVWGTVGCKAPANRTEILTRLRQKCAEISWVDKAAIAAKAMTTGLAFEINWLDPSVSILDKAISVVEAREWRPFISCVVATRGRPEMVKRSIQSFYDTTKGFDVEVIVASHPDEAVPQLIEMAKDKERYPRMNVVIADEMGSAVSAYNQAASHARGQFVMLWNDDYQATHNWLKIVIDKWESQGSPEVALLGLFDDDPRYLSDPPSLFAICLGTRKFFREHCGGVIAAPGYKSWFCDNETFERANAIGAAIRVEECRIDHFQARRGKGDMDDTARLGELRFANDSEVYRRRKSQGFPNNYEPVILS